MKKVTIGILDIEKDYVMKLTAYLQGYGKGRWDLTAFTQTESVEEYKKRKTLDMLVCSDREQLMQLGDKDCAKLWLSEEEREGVEKREDIYVVYRFQSAREIGKCMEGVIRQEKKREGDSCPLIALYSPVGRCGKTSLAMKVVKEGTYGKWLYVGMEDYSSFSIKDSQHLLTDELLFYWKEQREEKILELLEQMGDVVVTGTSYFDLKRITREDMRWFHRVVTNSAYRGVIVDMGIGMLESLQVLEAFSAVIVPYVVNEYADRKREHFENLLAVQGMVSCKEKLQYMNMDNTEEVIEKMDRLFGGAME